MAAIQSASVHLLTQQIYHHLDTDLPETANFLAGRLHAIDPKSPESAHLLALTYLRLRRFKAAADTSQKFGGSGRHLGCSYVFAQACLQLGRTPEGGAAMEKSTMLWKSRTQKLQQRYLPDASAGWTLLGKIMRADNQLRRASECFVEAHKANPLTWEAFDGLCDLGADLNVQRMFRPSAEMIPEGAVSTSSGKDEIYSDEVQVLSQPLAPQLNFNQQVFTPSADPFAVSMKPAGLPSEPPDKPKSKNAPRQPLSDWETPVANGDSIPDDDEDVAMSGVLADREGTTVRPPPAPARRTRPGQQHSDAPDRPRQPALRGQAVLVSETAEDASTIDQPRRKPSAAILGGHKRTISGHHAASSADSSAAAQHPSVRRSNRLFGQGTSSTSETRSTNSSSRVANAPSGGDGVRPAKPATGTKGRIQSTVGRVVSGNRKVLPPDRNNNKDEKEKRVPSRMSEREKPVTTVAAVSAEQKYPSKQRQASAAVQQPSAAPVDFTALVSTLDSLRTLASATYHLSRYEAPAALRILKSLPAAQRETPFVLAQLGKVHYESGDYKLAEESFARLLKLYPSRTQDIEVYSTVLWHLKKEAPLAFLCHTLRDSDSNAPQTWVAVGNAFSLSREHDSAIAAFKRAVQVDKKFGYAWTLMGHEYIANEDFDSAILAFRHAVSADRRSYGGWYGLGKCAERMGKLAEAERNYRLASFLNPSNSTLLVCIGLILERLRNRHSALAHYTKALELSPSSALARFKKARVLLHLRQYEDALEELEILKEVAPEEANVWFLLGKCYKGLGDRGEGLRCFTCALNLDGKAAPLIKEAMEALDEDDEEEGSEEE